MLIPFNLFNYKTRERFMKKVSFALSAMLMVIPLSACTGKPEASDVEGLIKEAWAPCKLVKVADVKKTNGVDQGQSYQMAISYKLELVQDVAAEDVWYSTIPPYVQPDFSSPSATGTPEWNERTAQLNAAHNAGKKRINEFLDNNCPGPIAGSRQMPVLGFVDAFKEKDGAALRKGDSADRVTEFTMIKTENGWMAQ